MGSMWVEDMAGLIDWNELARHAELIRFDARGHGNSSGSYHPRDYRWERMAEDMLAIAESVADEQGHARYALGGVSMGAATALAAAVQQPGRVAGLILACVTTASVAWQWLRSRGSRGPTRGTCRRRCEERRFPTCPIRRL